MSLNAMAVRWLMSSYLYYIVFKESPLSDIEFDNMSKQLLESYGEWKIHSDIITEDMLRAGSAYNLRMHDYPTITQVNAHDYAAGVFV